MQRNDIIRLIASLTVTFAAAWALSHFWVATSIFELIVMILVHGAMGACIGMATDVVLTDVRIHAIEARSASFFSTLRARVQRA